VHTVWFETGEARLSGLCRAKTRGIRRGHRSYLQASARTFRLSSVETPIKGYGQLQSRVLPESMVQDDVSMQWLQPPEDMR
jgi:hypothetical protein